MNQWDFYGRTPLYAAVDMNTLPKGRHVDLPSLDETTGLQVIQMLLDRGANPNAQLKLRVPHRQIPYDRYTEPHAEHRRDSAVARRARRATSRS